MILTVIFAEPVCKAIGASQDTIDYATQYLRIVAIGIPFLILSNAFSNIIRSEGRAKTAMSGMIIGNMANVILGHDLASRLECCRCRDCNRHRKYFIRGLLCIASSVKKITVIDSITGLQSRRQNCGFRICHWYPGITEQRAYECQQYLHQ